MREQKNVSALWLSGSCSFDTVGGLVIIKNVPVMVKLTAISLLLFSVKQHGVVKETLGGGNVASGCQHCPTIMCRMMLFDERLAPLFHGRHACLYAF